MWTWLNMDYEYQKCATLKCLITAWDSFNTSLVTGKIQGECPWLGGSVESTMQMKKDVECILSGPERSNSSFYLLAALSDIHSVLWKAQHSKHKDTKSPAAKGEFSKKFVDHTLPLNVTKEMLKHCLRKLEYYLSWSKDFASELCDT